VSGKTRWQEQRCKPGWRRRSRVAALRPPPPLTQVCWGAQRAAQRVAPVKELALPEIANLDCAVAAQHHILRLHIAMNLCQPGVEHLVCVWEPGAGAGEMLNRGTPGQAVRSRC
jgi:hypothetical protein